MRKDNWDDLRFVLAVAENGTVSAAARELGVNHATVLRRVAAFEERHGAPVFDRTAQGYAIRPDRLRLIEAARGVETAVLSVARMIGGDDTPVAGDVRVTSTDTFCLSVLPGMLAAIQGQFSGLRVSLLCSNDHLDLSRMHADIAVRPAERLPDGVLGEVAAQLGFGIYAAPGIGESWLGISGAPGRAPVGRWLAAHLDGRPVAGMSDSFPVLREMAARGLGRAVLPRCLGDGDDRLQRVMPQTDLPAVNIWVASHADLADVPRIAALRRALTGALQAAAPQLAGAD